jgi:hypothetical protein
MRHTIFLENEVIRWSTIPREIRLKEKQTCLSTPMVAEPFFSVPAAVKPIVHGNVVVEPIAESPAPMAATHIIGFLMTEIIKEEEPVFQEPITNHEEEQQ